MASVFREAINNLEGIGVLNIILPFIVVFTLVYAMLEKTKVLGVEKNGKAKHNINAMVSFCIGFFFIASASRVEQLATYLQFIGMLMVFLMCLFYVMAAFNMKEFYDYKNIFATLGMIGILIAFLYIVGLVNLKDYGFIIDLIFNPVIFLIVVFLILIGYITGEAPGPKKGKKKKSNESSSNNNSSPGSSSPQGPAPSQAQKDDIAIRKKYPAIFPKG